MPQQDNEKYWYAFKIFFGKGTPIKNYFISREIEYIYDVVKPYWDSPKIPKVKADIIWHYIIHGERFKKTKENTT